MINQPMDAITKWWLDTLSKEHPFYAIQLSHQFLDGTNRHECGFVPNNGNGKTLYFERETAK